MTDIVEALPKKLGFQRVSVLHFIWNRFLKRRGNKTQKQNPKQTIQQIQNKLLKHKPYLAYCLVENSPYAHDQCRGNLLTLQVSKGELPEADGKETVLEEESWQLACSELLTGAPHTLCRTLLPEQPLLGRVPCAHLPGISS